MRVLRFAVLNLSFGLRGLVFQSSGAKGLSGANEGSGLRFGFCPGGRI